MRRSLSLFLVAALIGVTASAGAAPVVAAPAVATVAADSGYVLGANDTITVQVYGQPDSGVTTRIKADGTIVMPLIGTVTAEGQTQLQLADVVKTKLIKGGYFKDPLVNVEIVAYVSKTVNVAGKVTTPGVFPLDKDYTVLEILLKSGWIREQGAGYVYLRRAKGGEEIKLDNESLVRGAPDKNLKLAPGDTLFVPDAETFFVYGQIGHPGAFPILKDMTLRQALAIAGGVTASGSERKVALIRAGGKEVRANIDAPVQKGDVYIVKERLF